MATLRLQPTLAELPSLFAGLRKNQVPYAASRAMNSTAHDAVNGMRAGLPLKFKIRNSRAKSSIQGPSRAYPELQAHKRQWPHLRSSVGVLDQWLARHEEGGVQTPERGSSFAIPARIVASRRGSKGVPKDLRPSSLRASKQARRAQDLLVATQELKKKSKRGSIRGSFVLYLLRRRIRLEPRLEGRSTLDDVTSAGFLGHFERELTAALLSESSRGSSISRRARSSPGFGRLLGFA